jgi:hypothetical protein
MKIKIHVTPKFFFLSLPFFSCCLPFFAFSKKNYKRKYFHFSLKIFLRMHTHKHTRRVESFHSYLFVRDLCVVVVWGNMSLNKFIFAVRWIVQILLSKNENNFFLLANQRKVFRNYLNVKLLRWEISNNKKKLFLTVGEFSLLNFFKTIINFLNLNTHKRGRRKKHRVSVYQHYVTSCLLAFYSSCRSQQ